MMYQTIDKRLIRIQSKYENFNELIAMKARRAGIICIAESSVDDIDSFYSIQLGIPVLENK